MDFPSMVVSSSRTVARLIPRYRRTPSCNRSRSRTRVFSILGRAIRSQTYRSRKPAGVRLPRLESCMSSLENRKRWFALALIVAAQFMVVLDVAIVNVALPSIKTDLHFSQESLQWVVTAYAILFGGLLLLGGRLA